MRRHPACSIICLFLILSFAAGPSRAWYDETHIAIARAAGYKHWYNAAGADIAKLKAGTKEAKNHFFDNSNNEAVSAKTVLTQADRYNQATDNEGHLYGAIISSLEDFRNAKETGKYAEYHLAYCVHYIGDLSQPLHNSVHDRFNKAHHALNDGIVESDVLDKMSEIRKNMYKINLRPGHLDEDLAREIARIANISRLLGVQLRAEQRDMTKGEAYVQLGHSASLLKSVLRAIGENEK